MKKINNMDCCEKQQFFCDLIKPLGFNYVHADDLFTSNVVSWQKKFGYSLAYDKSSPHFNMLIDCEPIYFNYDGKTWLIEFWKGQYGINIGAEIGIYRASKIISPFNYDKTLFFGIPVTGLLPLSMEVNYKGQKFFSVSRVHWWLTGFRIGKLCDPADLTLKASITFPNHEMLMCFTDSLKRNGYNDNCVSVNNLTVSLLFSTPFTKQYRFGKKITCTISSLENRIFCSIYNFITKPFICTTDKLLFIYYLLPFCFRHTLMLKKFRRTP